MQFAAYMTAETLREIREIIISVGFARMQPYGYCLCMERKTSSCWIRMRPFVKSYHPNYASTVSAPERNRLRVVNEVQSKAIEVVMDNIRYPHSNHISDFLLIFFKKNSHFSFRRNAKKCDESHQILSWKMHFYFVGQDAFCFFGQRQILKFRVIWQNLVTLTCKIEQKNTKLFWRHGKNLNFLLWRVNGGNGRLMESGVRKRSKWSLDQPQQLFEKFHHLRNFGSILPSK